MSSPHEQLDAWKLYLVADSPPSDVSPDGLDVSRTFETKEPRRRVRALALESVDPVQRCGRDSDQNVVVAELWVFDLL